MPPLRMFGYSHEDPPCSGNVLAFTIQPDEGIGLEMVAKVPGSRLLLKNVLMDFTYTGAFKQPIPDGYERLLLDAINGDATLFKRRDEVEAQWEFCTPILDAWSAAPPPQFPNYPAGSWGSDDAYRLLPSCEQSWHLESVHGL
jgi:glucose-6-phosphate 1-dehydrogenase